MTWAAIAAALLLWLTGVILRLGQWVNLFLLLAAVLLVLLVLDQRRPSGE